MRLSIAKHIRSLRKRAGLTQEELAQRLYVTRQTVSLWELGKTRPDVETLQAIADCLGVDLLQTRVFGSVIYVDMEIAADGSHTLREAHDIAETVHDAIEAAFPQIKHIMVHVNPDTERDKPEG